VKDERGEGSGREERKGESGRSLRTWVELREGCICGSCVQGYSD